MPRGVSTTRCFDKNAADFATWKFVTPSGHGARLAAANQVRDGFDGEFDGQDGLCDEVVSTDQDARERLSKSLCAVT